MKYFLDTEFIEGTQKSIFNNKPTIDLISIGIVAEDGREYYAISKDFNLKEAWNRYDLKNVRTQESLENDYIDYENIKVYWIRDNVLKPIWEELVVKEFKVDFLAELENPFTYKGLKYLIKKYGKTNKQIAKEIIEFCTVNENRGNGILEQINNFKDSFNRTIQFYGYYADYDWVVFCWLFGRMIDLPKGFPMYCIDLKQTLDETVLKIKSENDGKLYFTYSPYAVEYKDIEKHHNYPKQTNEHNALADARWNYELYKFLNSL